MSTTNGITFDQICHTAILRSGAMTNKNSFELLENLASTLIEHKQYTTLTRDEFKNDFYDFYHLNLNSIVLGEVLHRLCVKKLLKKIDKSSFQVNKTELDKINGLTSLESFTTECSLFIDNLHEYLKRNGLNLTKQESEIILARHIEESVTILGNPLSKNELMNPVESYLMDSFIKEIKDSDDYNRIYKNILVGRLLASFIVNNSDVSFDDDLLLNKLNVYLDTGIVFRILGLDNYSTSDEYLDMIKTLVNLGAHIKIFRHIYDEVCDIIDGSKFWINNFDYSPESASRVADYFVTNKYSIEDIDEYLVKLEGKLSDLNIEIVDLDLDYNIPDPYGLYEENIFTKLKDIYRSTGFFQEDKIDTYRNDAKSIFYIHKLRKGYNPKRINEVKHILLTSNRGLTKVSRECTCGSGNSISYAVTDAYLSLLLFFTYPGYSDETNIRFLIPTAYHAFKPSKELLIKMEQVLREMKEKGVLTEKEVFSWMSNVTLGEEILGVTKNNPDNFDDTTPDKVMKKIKDDAEEMVNKKALEAKEKITDAENKAHESLSLLIKSEQSRSKLIEELNEKDNKRIMDLSKEKDNLEKNATRKASFFKFFFFVIFLTIFVGLLGLGAYLVDLFSDINVVYIPYIISAVLAVFIGSFSCKWLLTICEKIAVKISRNKHNIDSISALKQEIEEIKRAIDSRK